MILKQKLLNHFTYMHVTLEQDKQFFMPFTHPDRVTTTSHRFKQDNKTCKKTQYQHSYLLELYFHSLTILEIMHMHNFTIQAAYHTEQKFGKLWAC